MSTDEFNSEIYWQRMQCAVNKLKSLRLQHGYTMKYISDLTGLSAKTVSRIENFKNFPREKTLARIAQCYSLAVEDLFDFSSDYLHVKKCYNKGGRRYFMYF